MHILIADDEDEMRHFLKEFLTGHGHSVDGAADGKKALELLQQNTYDLAFLDHDMPEMTGLELAKYIKKNHLKIKVVLISGYPLLKDFFVKAMGTDSFLTKPFTLEQLLKITEL